MARLWGWNDSGQGPAVRGQGSGVRDQFLVVSCQWSVVRVGGQWPVIDDAGFRGLPLSNNQRPKSLTTDYDFSHGLERWPLITNSSSNPEIPTDDSVHWRLITDHWPLVPDPCFSV